jgi:hypothetical protein
MSLSELIGGMTVIAPMPIREAEQAILSHARKELSFKVPQPENDGAIVSRDRH